MKKIFLSLIMTTLLWSCSKSNVNNSNCQFLLNVGVNLSINMNLPIYSQLQFPLGSVYVANVGNGGLIVINTGTGFLAWDAADPNRVPAACSVLSVSGIEGTSSCSDSNTYSLITGQPLSDSSLPCGLKAYRVDHNGSNLIITN